MREIKFRALEKDGDWFYWDLLTNWDFPEVNLETIGEFTGLKDKNGKEIYEGDIIQSLTSKPRMIKDIFDFTRNKKVARNFEVIGNIYENKELLK